MLLRVLMEFQLHSESTSVFGIFIDRVGFHIKPAGNLRDCGTSRQMRVMLLLTADCSLEWVGKRIRTTIELPSWTRGES